MLGIYFFLLSMLVEGCVAHVSWFGVAIFWSLLTSFIAFRFAPSSPPPLKESDFGFRIFFDLTHSH
jgi:hypothetical protein